MTTACRLTQPLPSSTTAEEESAYLPITENEDCRPTPSPTVTHPTSPITSPPFVIIGSHLHRHSSSSIATSRLPPPCPQQRQARAEDADHHLPSPLTPSSPRRTTPTSRDPHLHATTLPTTEVEDTTQPPAAHSPTPTIEGGGEHAIFTSSPTPTIFDVEVTRFLLFRWL
ncbi:hypothetical protein Dimus_023834 [Dionaea muscipula]